MQQSRHLHEEIEPFLQSFNEQEGTEPERKGGEGEELEEIDVYFVRRPKKGEAETAEDEAIAPRHRPRRTVSLAALVALAVNILFTLCVIVFAIVPELTASVTVTLVSKSEQETLLGTLQLGRVLPSITLSQSQTTPTTGHVHQDAKQATGTLTLYNGQFQSVIIAAGRTFTDNDGVQVVTDQDAVIPAANPNPPVFGQVSVSAHAVLSGARGNIRAYDMNQPCCFTSVIAKNGQAFSGGQDERDYQTVAKTDIDSTATPMKATLAQSMQGVFQGQRTPTEQVQLLPCTPTVAADHHPGAEATHVQVTVSQTCSAVVYTKAILLQRATAFLSIQALKHLGAGYSLLGDVHVTITGATTTQNTPVVFSFTCSGTWVFALSQAAQQHIKTLIAGKTKQRALHLLRSLPGVQSVTIAGIGDTRKLPDLTRIHLFLIVEG